MLYYLCDSEGILTLDFQNRNLTFYTTELRSREKVFRKPAEAEGLSSSENQMQSYEILSIYQLSDAQRFRDGINFLLSIGHSLLVVSR